MTQGVKDLIYAIAEGDAVAIDAAFNAEMADRISARLDDMRIDVAQNMFKEQVEEEQELTLEDYSAEEIDEYMQSEEFEQLDELSKDTLKSYRSKIGRDLDRADEVGPHGTGDDNEDRKLNNRMVGDERAAKRLMKK